MYRFTEDCRTGIEVIDKEHERLFGLINEAMQLLEETDGSVELAKNMIAALKKYAAEHFDHEEAYMQEHADPELERQKKEHARFVAKVEQMEQTPVTEEDSRAVLEDMLQFLAKWLYHHILGSDIMIGKIAPVGAEDDPFAFTDQYHTGIALVDEEHKRLFEIIRETDQVIHAELLHDKYDEIMRILAELKDYTVLHFQDEEEYMERIGYEGLPGQKRAHEAFVEKLTEINLDEVDDNQQEYLEELIAFLLGWLSNHILKADKKIPLEK